MNGSGIPLLPKKLKTDVVKMSDTFIFQNGPVIGPGDIVVRRKNRGSAAVGIAISHPVYGPMVTTAGHLFSKYRKGELVAIQSEDTTINGRVVNRVMSVDTDYAIIQITDDSKVANLFRDLYAVGPLHFINKHDIGKKMFLLTPKRFSEVICKGIYGSFTWLGGKSMHNLIFTSPRGVPGNSGCCLITQKSTICGLLVGQVYMEGSFYSAFTPAHIPVWKENAQLI